MKYIFTCEHGGNKIPAEYSNLFKPHRILLETHRGYDIGILEIFKYFTQQFEVPNYYSEISRLIIELNRSTHHKDLFSFITKPLDEQAKENIISNYYLPYRDQVTVEINSLIKQNQNVIHISFHSFAPVLNKKERKADIGLLYDPKSEKEKAFCKKWKNELLLAHPNLKVRFNYPYLGIADGFTSYLRKRFGYDKYRGIELEVNQKLLQSPIGIQEIQKLLVNSFQRIS